MKECLLAIILLFTLNPLSVTAQGTVDGCLLSDNLVYTDYTSLLGARLYSSTPTTSLSANYCSWTASSTVSCNVCFGAINALALLCVGGPVVGGQRGVYTMVECNLDDHSWVLGAAAGLFGLFIIKRRNKL
ncbi:hypothetical protein CA265_01845 [Sphingobacteriaceae bacterium GW460-11-11-14-LB5]|nr:hypothetical protein CA265_01845 [Sphingobacteriaceae bacterium GW460-11-11-14-LB5]